MAQYGSDSDLLIFSLSAEQADQFEPAARNAALIAASAFADSYLTSQFTLPLKSWDAGLTLHVCNLAAYWLFARRGYNPESPEDRVIKERADEAKAWLKDIAEENLHPQWLDASGGSDTDDAGPFVITSESRGWRTESDLITDIDAISINELTDPFAGL